MFKYLFLFVSLVSITSCTLMSHKFNLYSGGDIKLDGKSAKVEKVGTRVEKEFCNHIPLIIPLSNKNQFNVMDDLIAENEGFNALANGKVETTFLNIPILYMKICHKVEGTPVFLTQ